MWKKSRGGPVGEVRGGKIWRKGRKAEERESRGSNVSESRGEKVEG